MTDVKFVESAYEVLTCVECHRTFPLDEAVGEGTALFATLGGGRVICYTCLIDSKITDAMQRRLPDAPLDPDNGAAMPETPGNYDGHEEECP